MTILFVQPLETRLSRDSSYSYRRTNIFRVRSDDVYEDPKDVMFAAAGGPYDSEDEEAMFAPRDPERSTWEWGEEDVKQDTSQEVTEIDVRNEIPMGQKTGDRRLWIVTFTYQDWLFRRPGQAQPNPKKRGEDNGQEDDILNPLDEEIRYAGTYFSTEEWVSATQDGTPITNSAEQPYPEQRVSKDYDTIIIERNIDIVDEDDRKASVNTVNSTAFWGLDARTLKLARWYFPDGVLYYTDANGNRQSYVRSIMEFHVNRDTWDISHPDWGTLTLENAGSNDPKVRYATIDVADTDARTLPTPSNVLLDGSGSVNEDPSTVDAAATRGPFEMLAEVDYSSGIYAQLIPQQLPTAMGG